MGQSNEPTGTHSLHELIGETVPPFPFQLEKRDRKGEPHTLLVRNPDELVMFAPDDPDNVARIIEGRLNIVSRVD